MCKTLIFVMVSAEKLRTSKETRSPASGWGIWMDKPSVPNHPLSNRIVVIR